MSGQRGEAASVAMVLAGGMLWGCISLFVRALGAAGLTSPEISGVRLIVGAVGMALVLLVRDRSLFAIRPRDIWIFIGTGIISVTLFNICYFYCMQMSEASIAVVLLYTSPIWIMLMSAVFFKERITPVKLVALVMTFAGCVLVAGVLGTGLRIGPLAIVLGVASGVFYATYSIFGRVALARYDTMTVTFWTFLTGAVAALFIGHPLHVLSVVAATPSVALWALGIGVFCTIVPYLLYTRGLQGMDTGRAGILACSEPVVGALLGIFVYGDTAGAAKVCGMLLILAAIILLNLKMQQMGTE